MEGNAQPPLDHAAAFQEFRKIIASSIRYLTQLHRNPFVEKIHKAVSFTDFKVNPEGYDND